MYLDICSVLVYEGVYQTSGKLNPSDCIWTWGDGGLDVGSFIDLPTSDNQLYLDLTLPDSPDNHTMISTHEGIPDTWGTICERPTTPATPFNCSYPCLNGGRCVLMAGSRSYSCECPQHYTGVRCEKGMLVHSEYYKFIKQV